MTYILPPAATPYSSSSASGNGAPSVYFAWVSAPRVNAATRASVDAIGNPALHIGYMCDYLRGAWWAGTRNLLYIKSAGGQAAFGGFRRSYCPEVQGSEVQGSRFAPKFKVPGSRFRS